jgi:hypothetical protein
MGGLMLLQNLIAPCQRHSPLWLAAWRSPILGAEGMRSSENPAIGVTMIQRPNPSPVHQTKG